MLLEEYFIIFPRLVHVYQLNKKSPCMVLEACFFKFSG